VSHLSLVGIVAKRDSIDPDAQNPRCGIGYRCSVLGVKFTIVKFTGHYHYGCVGKELQDMTSEQTTRKEG
jgi:hypothetical protein